MPPILVVRRGTGGAKPLTDAGRADIKTNMERKVLDFNLLQQVQRRRAHVLQVGWFMAG